MYCEFFAPAAVADKKEVKVGWQKLQSAYYGVLIFLPAKSGDHHNLARAGSYGFKLR